ncbi:MAG TPA: MobF family relaxase [Candidatus Angelobacter sp.]|nr:MobF family relaxase [Candidatus Angelobacter sp.]
MLRITASTSASGAKRYYGENLTRNDYYIEGQEVAGEWGGKAAEQLCLSGQVDAPRYFALCDNLHPSGNGQQLTPRRKDNRRVAFDWTFSAPKAVSVLYEMSGDEAIVKAFQASYRETLNEAEAEMKTRVRVKGKNEDRITGNMAWAEFLHFTARPVNGKPMPHLHAHCMVFNVTHDDTEQRWKASQQGDLKRDADYWEAAFHTRFAKRLNDLGYATVKKGTSFTLANLPQSITDKFSERRNEIEQQAAALGIVSAEGKHSIGYFGREHKTVGLGKAELRREWTARLSHAEREALQKVMAGEESGGRGISTDEAVAYSLEHSFERVSALSEKRVKAEALRYGVGSVLPEAVERLSRHADVVAMDVNGQRMMTTKAVLSDEIAMLQFARSGHNRFAPLLHAPGKFPGLSEEQQMAARHVLLSSDRVVGIRGGAGTGKTRMMKATIAAIESNAAVAGDYNKVFVFAPSAQASRGVLKAEGMANADTLERFLVDEKLQQAARKQVLWVDEAGMISNHSMQRLFAVARQQQCRIILSGDYRQHASVEAGDSFRLLESEAGVRLFELKKIRRQQNPQYRKAVEEISQGSVKGVQRGFDRLNRMGAIIEATAEERHRLLVNDYLKAVEDSASSLIIAPTHAEGKRLTDALRKALRERSKLGQEREFIVREPTNWTEAQRRDPRNYESGMVVEFHQAVPGVRQRDHGARETKGGFARGARAVVIQGGKAVRLQCEDGTQTVLPAEHAGRFQVYATDKLAVAAGDRVRITKNGYAKAENGKPIRLNNGETFTVEGFNDKGDIRLSDGKVLPKGYSHWELGHVSTSHSAQGQTLDRVFIAAGHESLGAVGQQQWYVSVSRARHECKVYVEDKAEIRSAIARSGERLSAVELVSQNARVMSDVHAGLMERNRVWRFLKERAAAIAAGLRHQMQAREAPKGGMSYV